MVGCVRMASRRLVKGMPASIAVCTTAMTSPASGPSMVKPRMQVAVGGDDGLHEAARLGDGVRAHDRGDGQGGGADGDALPRRLALAQADAGELGVGEHAVGHEAALRAAAAAREIVADDAEIVEGGVGELRAAGALADGPDIGGRGLQAVVDIDKTAVVEGDAGRIEADAGGVGRAADGDQDVGGLERLLPGGGVQAQGDALAGFSLDAGEPRSSMDLEALVLQHLLERGGDVLVLAGGEAGARLQDGDAGAEAALRLGQLEADIAAAQDDEMLRARGRARAPRCG